MNLKINLELKSLNLDKEIIVILLDPRSAFSPDKLSLIKGITGKFIKFILNA